MKRKIAIAIVLMGLLVAALALAQTKKSAAGRQSASVSAQISEAAKTAAATGCDAALWTHVYHKARLHVVEKCITVTGVIRHIKKEADGDDHIQVALDPQFVNLLNARNKSAQADSLVIEPVCQGPVTQADAQTACRDFHSPVDVPANGTKIRVTGSFVLDAEANHGWMEIHPVSSIETQ